MIEFLAKLKKILETALKFLPLIIEILQDYADDGLRNKSNRDV